MGLKPKTIEPGDPVGLDQPDSYNIPVLAYVTQGDLMIVERLEKIAAILEQIKEAE